MDGVQPARHPAHGREGPAGGGRRQGQPHRRRQEGGAARYRRRARDPAAGRRARCPDRDRRQGPCRPVQGRAGQHVRGAARAPSELARPLAGGDRAQHRPSLRAGREPCLLLRRDPRDLRRGLPASQALPPERGRPPDVRGVDPRPGDRGRAHLPDRRGDRLPGRPAAEAVRRRDLHRGGRRHRHVPRARRAAHRHHRRRPLGQRLHRPDRHHAGQPGGRRHAHDRAEPDRMAGPAAHLGAGDLHAAARLLGRHDRPAGRRGRLHRLSRLHVRSILRAAARHGRGRGTSTSA